MPVSIERLTEADLAQVMAINQSALPEHYDYPTWLSYITEFPDGCFVANMNGTVVGYVIGRLADSVLYLSSLSGPTKVGHIVSIATDQSVRRMGIGKQLLTKAIDAMIARQANGVMLQVRASNTPAIDLYLKYGFKKASIVSRYYQDGEAAYVMYRPLLPMSSIT